MMSRKIIAQAMELKCLIQRSMSADDVERATRHCNGIIAEAERVAGLENEVVGHAGGPSAAPQLEAVR